MVSVSDIHWFKQQFGNDISAAVAGTPFDADMITAIACQETGYIWSILRKKGLPRERILALCVGDTIDYKGPGKGRQAFPRNKADLLGKPDGERMFDIARTALEDMAAYVPGYAGAASNPDKFCRGFGLLQRDLQFFKNDPDYFLGQHYEEFAETLRHCLEELRRGLKKVGLDGRGSISDRQFASVAIAYNTGGYNPAKGLKQGYFDGSKYYGENIADYLAMCRSAPSGIAMATGSYTVVAREGLNLRGGPGTQFETLKTLASGTSLKVVGTGGQDNGWAQVDLEDDGLFDGFVFASFLASAGSHPVYAEHVDEPD